jgi:hypothetical protein
MVELKHGLDIELIVCVFVFLRVLQIYMFVSGHKLIHHLFRLLLSRTAVTLNSVKVCFYIELLH